MQVKVARWDGATWDVELISSGSYNALALDAQGRPNIVLRDESTVKWGVL